MKTVGDEYAVIFDYTFTVASKINYKRSCKNLNNALETGICQKMHSKNIIKIIRIL